MTDYEGLIAQADERMLRISTELAREIRYNLRNDPERRIAVAKQCKNFIENLVEHHAGFVEGITPYTLSIESFITFENEQQEKLRLFRRRNF
jgi:hypothetical protein